MRFRIAFCVSLGACVGAVSAATVTADQAKTAVQRWLRDDPALGCPVQGAVSEVRTCTPMNGASFHVVKLAAGGFVVTSADTRRAPVVAFSSGADLVEDDANPLWVLLKRDLAIRTQGEFSGGGAQLMGAAPSEVEAANEAKWAKLLGGGAQLMSAQGIASVSDVRVAPLLQSKWGQDTVGNGNCFNYYTPSNYVCGCVATAGAQIMRYFCYPTAAMPQYTNPNCAVDGTLTTLTTQGGTYDWGQMPLVPVSSMIDVQRQAIGKLTSDLGICCCMSYRPAVSGGSGAGVYMLAHALTTYFGYASAQIAQWGQLVDKSGSEDVRNALLSNFDAGFPVALSLYGVSGGHAVVGDGYGYSDGTLYIHFNMGWEGLDDAWYTPPAMSTTQIDFSILNGVVYNIFPKWPANMVIYSGRVLDANGVPVEGATVAFSENHSPMSGIEGAGLVGYVPTNAKGIYSLPLVPGDYSLTAFYGNSHAELNVQVTANVATPIALPDGYSYSPAPKVNNRCGVDFVLSDVASVATPQFTPPSCLFYPSTNVIISCATDGATIRYTIDGNDPTESSAIYTDPILVNDDATIKARAWKNGMNPSVIVTATYTYDASETSTTEVPVPYTWLDGYFAGQGTSAQAYEALANADQDNDGFTTWQEYLAGTDPTSAASCLQVSIRMVESTPTLEWNVTNNNVQALGYRYVPKGKANLTDSGAWQPFAANHRFFKVFIEPVQ